MRFDYLKDVLLLLALCVDRRAKRVGLHGKGVTLKLTYADMKAISRSQGVFSTDSVVEIYRTAAQMLDQVDHRSVRLIGVSIYNLSGEEERQLSLDDLLENSARRKETELHALLEGLGQRYGLDFAGHLEQIYQTDTLHKTVEYMRKHV